MSNLLDAILGSFNSGQSGGFIPGSMLRDAPSSGYLPEDQVSTPPTDPYGNRVGGPAPGVPLPRPRPPEAGPAAFSPGVSPPDMQPGESGGVGDGSGGGLPAALGLNPETMRRISAGLAGGLSNVKNSPFAGQVAANAAGGAFAAGNKSDETAINQALKLRQIDLRRRALGRSDDGTPLPNAPGLQAMVPSESGMMAQALPGSPAAGAAPTKTPVIDEEIRKAAQADRAGTLAQAHDAVTRDPGKRAAIIERLRQLGIAF